MKRLLEVTLLAFGVALHANAQMYSSQTFNSGFQNAGAIPDGSLNGWSDTRIVTGVGIHHVADVRLTLTISNGYAGDLYAYLAHGDAQAVLLNRVGLASTNAFGYPDAGLDLTFSASGLSNVHFYQNFSPSFDGEGWLAGTWQPDARGIDPLSAPLAFDAPGTADLSTFFNQDPNGEWTLFVADVSAGGGQSTVLSWGLQIDTVTETAMSVVITSVNDGVAPVAGTPFSVTVQAQDVNGVPANVTADTEVTLSLKSGNGILGGNLAGTIASGTSSVTINSVTYSKAQSGVTLTSTPTSGNNLTAGDSSAFTVNPGVFAQLQVLMPGEATAPGSVIGKTGHPVSQTVGTAFNVTVHAVDFNWNLIDTNDVVHFTSSDGDAVLPSDVALAGGTGTLSVAFYQAGSQTVRASDITHSGIAPTTGSATTVNAGDQAITFMSPGDQTYGVPAITLAATTSSGLPVAYEVTAGPATVSDNILIITGAGLVTIQTSQPGNANWNAALPIDQTINVSPKPLIPNITASDKVYDGLTSATIASRSLTGVINSDLVSLTAAISSFANPAVGLDKTVTATGLSLGGNDAEKYVLVSTTATTTATIARAGVTIASGITANSKVFDALGAATLTSNSVVLIGVLGSDSQNVRLFTNGYSASFATPTVGNSKAVSVTGLTLAGAAADNYALTQPDMLTADITPGMVARLAFTTQPALASAGAIFGQQPVVRTQDLYGNDSAAGLAAHLMVSVILSAGTGWLQGTETLDIGTSAGNGSVSFNNLRIDPAGDKQLTASANELTAALSTTFNVANVAPEVSTATFSRPRNVPLKILILNLLTNALDLNGDTLRLAAVSASSTNGATLYTNSTYVCYSLPPGGNISDSFSYIVSDGTVTSTGTVVINIAPDPAGTNSNVAAYGLVNGLPSMTFAGVPGYTYVVQRTQDLGAPTWMELLTTNAPAHGLFQFLDQNPPTGNLFYRAQNQ